MDHLEYFEPYEIKAHFENALTRAYLALLRLSPLARMSFLDAVRATQTEDGIEPLVPALSEMREKVAFRTQVGSDLGREAGYLASIVLTGEPWTATEVLSPSERGYVYDGVIETGDWVLIVENKPWTDVWEEQLRPNLPSDTQIEPVGPISITWRDLIQRLNCLLETEVLSVVEALLVDDFRSYVDRHFDHLNPYPEVRDCGVSPLRLQRRCNQVLEDTAKDLGLEMVPRRGRENPVALPDGAAREAYLRPCLEGTDSSPTGLKLCLYPGDTVNQAREFFRSVDIGRFLALEISGWRLEPIPHLAYMATNLCYWVPAMSLAEYMTFLQNNPTCIRQLRRGDDDFQFELQQLASSKLLPKVAPGCIERDFVGTSRTNANFAPGVQLEFVWSLEVASDLDSRRELGGEVVSRLREAMATWGQRLEG